MPKNWTDQFSFITGAVRFADLAYFAMVNDELAAGRHPHTYLIARDGDEWIGQDDPLPWDTVSMCIATSPLEQALAMGPDGEVMCVGSGDVHREAIHDGPHSPETRGPLRAIRTVDGLVYAAGMNRQVYRRESANSWIAWDQGARPDAGRKEVVGFEAIDGFSGNDLYAVGWDGAIWQFNGSQWLERSSPTNFVLTSVCCGQDGQVYAASRKGLLICGRNDQWRVIDHQSTISDFWGLAWFRDRLYLSTNREVYKLNDDETLDRMSMDGMDGGPADTCFHLATDGNVLMSIGPKDIVCYDGDTWERIE